MSSNVSNIFDVFKSQQTADIARILEGNNIYTDSIPLNCTDHLMDLSVNKVAKEFMRNQFSDWYALEVNKLNNKFLT